MNTTIHNTKGRCKDINNNNINTNSSSNNSSNSSNTNINSLAQVKLEYSEKATKFEKNLPLKI